jgi:hypothetical protein
MTLTLFGAVGSPTLMPGRITHAVLFGRRRARRA